MARKRKPLTEEDRERAAEERRERLYAPGAPGESLTLEEWRALGFDIGGKQTRPRTDPPMGYKPRPRPETPTT